MAPKAFTDLDKAYVWWSENRSLEQAARWFNSITKKIARLKIRPEQHPIALENERFAIELRQHLFGLGRKPSHRIVFTIRPDMIYILRIRHVAPDLLDPESL